MLTKAVSGFLVAGSLIVAIFVLVFPNGAKAAAEAVQPAVRIAAVLAASIGWRWIVILGEVAVLVGDILAGEFVAERYLRLARRKSRACLGVLVLLLGFACIPHEWLPHFARLTLLSCLAHIAYQVLLELLRRRRLVPMNEQSALGDGGGDNRNNGSRFVAATGEDEGDKTGRHPRTRIGPEHIESPAQGSENSSMS